MSRINNNWFANLTNERDHIAEATTTVPKPLKLPTRVIEGELVRVNVRHCE